MKKEIEVTSYRVFDRNNNILFNGDCETVEEAEGLALNDENKRYQDWLESHSGQPFNSHGYIIVKLRGVAIIEIEDDSKVPSFRELCEALPFWDDSEIVKNVDLYGVG